MAIDSLIDTYYAPTIEARGSNMGPELGGTSMTLMLTAEERICLTIADSCTLANQARENIVARAQALRERDYTTASSLTEVAKEQAWEALALALKAKNAAEDAGDETQRTRAQGALDRAGILWEGARRFRIV